MVGPYSSFNLFEAQCNLGTLHAPEGASGGPWIDLKTGTLGLVNDTATGSADTPASEMYGAQLEDDAVNAWSCIDTGTYC